jgi:hypothetical protein
MSHLIVPKKDLLVDLFLTDSVINENSAGGSGGGIYLTFTNSTIKETNI